VVYKENADNVMKTQEELGEELSWTEVIRATIKEDATKSAQNTFDLKGIKISFPCVSACFGEASKLFALDIA
jgi:hypothetical protein